MNDTTLICPICEEGHLTPAVHDLAIKHGGRTLTVRGLEHSVCDVCGEEPVLTAQIRHNQKKVADAKRAADRLLVADEIVAIRRELNLTQQDAAALFGGGANAFSKYERGEVIQSVAMDRLLRLIDLCPYLLPALQEMAGVAVSAERVSTSYADGTPVCVNDPQYRSRTVAGVVVEVDRAEWQAA